MSDFELPPVPNFQLREPELRLPPPRAPSLEVPELRTELPSLAIPPNPYVLPDPAAASDLFGHLADPPGGHAAPGGGHGGGHGHGPNLSIAPHRDPLSGDVSIGPRLELPIGPLELDAGVGVNPRNGDAVAGGSATLPIAPGVRAGVTGEGAVDPAHPDHPHWNVGGVIRGTF
jgi:hypothetical protein